MKTTAALPLAVSSSEIDGLSAYDSQDAVAIKESGSDTASTNSVSVVVPGVHLTLKRGVFGPMITFAVMPRATSTENSGQMECVNHHTYAAAQE